MVTSFLAQVGRCSVQRRVGTGTSTSGDTPDDKPSSCIGDELRDGQATSTGAQALQRTTIAVCPQLSSISSPPACPPVKSVPLTARRFEVTSATDVIGTCGEDAALRLLSSGLEVTGIGARLLGGECACWACLPKSRRSARPTSSRRLHAPTVSSAMSRSSSIGHWLRRGCAPRSPAKGMTHPRWRDSKATRGRFVRGRVSCSGQRPWQSMGWRSKQGEASSSPLAPRPHPTHPRACRRRLLDNPRGDQHRDCAAVSDGAQGRSSLLRARSSLRTLRRRGDDHRGRRAAIAR